MGLAARRALASLSVLVLLLAGLPAAHRRATAEPRAQSVPVTSHPRLWLTADDLPRLRGWATEANPLWQDGLLVLADQLKADMDSGKVPGQDTGSDAWEEYPTESYAEFFAFMSLIHPDAAARADYANHARTLLMGVINEAAKGPAGDDSPFREPGFATSDSDRSRWWGEAFPLTVDWIYPSLTTEDKLAIRTVFLRWSEEIVTAGYHHAEPVAVTNDPSLYADPTALRWSGNNYVTAHMRNLGLMAMAFDPADDPGGKLHDYLKLAIGSGLYMVDHLFRTDARGGLAPEGFEYSPQAVGYVAQFLLALHTAGEDDPATWGAYVQFKDNPFWDEVIPAYLHSLSPQPVVVPGYEYLGPVYQPAWYGDGQTYWAPDMIELLGPIGRYDDLTGNSARLDAIRWIETNLAPGGTAQLTERVADPEAHHDAILLFLLFDPTAPAPADPRPNLPLFHFAPGIGRFSARTGWDENAAWFTYALGWIAVDHQFGDGNQFEFYRHGEWLTKGLVGYGISIGDNGYDFPSSEYHNTLALQNDQPDHNEPDDYRHQSWLRGSQWEYDPAGDPAILAMSVAPGYAYALGDATNLYNSTYESATDITQASRSIVWLAPDAIVVYDRAASKTDGRFKRFWLNLPAPAIVDGNRTAMTTASGQQLVVTTLAPTDAPPTVQPLDVRVDDMAAGEPMRYRLLVEAPGAPRETRFLNVHQGADPGAQTPAVTSIASDDGSFTGAAVGTTAILFPVDLGTDVSELHYSVPAGTTTHLITGLTPGAGYDLTTTTASDGVAVTVTTGITYRADGGGVLLVGSLPAALGTSSFAFTNVPSPVAATPEATEETTSGATPEPEPAATEPIASPAVEGGAAASGAGQVVYTVFDGQPRAGHVFRIDARAGATPEDVSAALDALSPSAPDEAVNISPDATSLVLTTERFDPACTGWPCLAVVPADLSSAEVVRIGDEVVHPEGRAAIAGDVVVYSGSGGPHDRDLWATRRDGDAWSTPILLTADSPYAEHAEVAIAADGSRVVFDCANEPYGAEGTAICEANTDGTGFRVVLTPADAPSGLPTTGALVHPAYAPDGSIVFEGDWGSETIWRLPAGAAQPEPVAPAFDNDNAPCVLSDGRVASLWLNRPGGQSLHEIKVMTPDGASYAMIVTDLDVEDIGCGG